MRRALALPTILILAAAALDPLSANAALLAADDASQSTYGDGWQTGDNGGSGFGAWSISTTANSGVFVGSSDIGTASWALWANSGGLAQATRSFTTALAVGNTFSLQMDNGLIDSGRSVGFVLRSGSTDRFQFYFNGGATSYYIHDSRGWDQTTGISHTTGGLDISFKLNANNSYTLDIGAFSYTGNLVNSGNIDTLYFYNSSAGSGTDHNLYFDSLQVVPEPIPAALAIFGGFFAVSYGLRRFTRKESV